MERCERCGKVYDPEMAEIDFETAMDGLVYEDECEGLCADCAVQRIMNQIPPEYRPTMSYVDDYDPYE